VEKTILFLQQLLECTTGVPLNCIPYAESAISDFLTNSTKHIFDRLFRQGNSSWRRLLAPPIQSNALCVHTLIGGITFLTYAGKDENHAIFLGPVLTQPFSREDTLCMLEKQNVPPQSIGDILQFCSELPVVSGHILYRIGDLVIRHLSGIEKPLTIIQAGISNPEDHYLLHQAIPANENIVQMRQVEMRYEYSAALTDAVRRGNLSLALYMIGQHSPTEQTDVRNTNPLRNAQNYCFVLNTQLRHALEASGIHPYRVDRLSNQIGLEIEQLKSLSQVSEFFKQILLRYCRLVQEHTYPNLKPLTNLAVTYIKEHLTDNLTVKDTAKALTVNANYLSALFHKEMGISFIDFVNKERTDQAASLLTHTNLQIQQIASSVGYNNTSYFAKQFLRFQGVSPSQYRRN
jgi:AraC-like DNA-binding protein